MNNFWIMILCYYIHFFYSITLIGLQCSIPNTSCNFEKFCISYYACSNCFNKVVIFLLATPCTLWDEPHPPCEMPMMPNMLEVKHTNQGYHTFCICCTWVWSSSHLDYVFFLLDQRPSSHSIFALHVNCSTFIEVWSYHLRPLGRIDGHLNLPNCVWRPCVWSKCLWNNRLAT
jgi:hypothetical protein